MSEHSSFVVCVENPGYQASLELRKIYRQLADARAEQDGFVRVIDESGEDYLYPKHFFVPISVPEAVERTFSGVA